MSRHGCAGKEATNQSPSKNNVRKKNLKKKNGNKIKGI